VSAARPDILCLGAALWDVIGRSPAALPRGADVPGRIATVPGGVALNIAVALAGLGLRPALLGAVGDDPEGAALVAAMAARGVGAGWLTVMPGLATDRYMAIEDAGGLVAAIADAQTLEAAGAAILGPLADGRLGSAADPWAGPVVIDGNLPDAVLAGIAASPLFAAATLHVAPASPGKGARVAPLAAHPRATLYVNRAEAEGIAGRPFADAAAAAAGLVAAGAARAVVTDGARSAADAARGRPTEVGHPPPIAVARVTGAGDVFMAAHLAAGLGGADPAAALAAALAAAAAHVSGASS
jgi:sugar/nucleoside kinase (ribokinase family)